MNRRTFFTAGAAFVGSLGGFKSVLLQADPSRPIHLIVGVPPGGAIDPYARLISEHMAKSLGRVIIVEINPSVRGDLKWTMNDFIPLIRGVTAPLVLVAHPSVAARTLPELVTWIKKNPGKLSYSSYEAGTPSHFLGFQLNERFGLDLVHVPTRGSGPQATDLMAGHVLFGFAQIQPTLAHIKAGKLNAIAVTSGGRSRFLPDVPTFAELGHPEFAANVWFGLMVRSGTPSGLVETLLNAAKAAHDDPGVRAKLEAQGFDISGQNGPEFAADIKAQIERWARLVKATGFNAE